MIKEDIDRLVKERHAHRLTRDYSGSDAILRRLKEQGVRVVDRPISSGEESSWVFIKKIDKTNILELVRRASRGLADVDAACADIARQLQQFFAADGTPLSLEEVGLEHREIQGRMFADIAFTLALAGAREKKVFHWLTRGAVFELQRMGARRSCRVQDLCQIAERFACAGVLDQVCTCNGLCGNIVISLLHSLCDRACIP